MNIRNLFLLATLVPSLMYGTTVSISGSIVFKSDSTSLLTNGSYISVGYFDSGFANFTGLATRTWTDINSGDYTEIFNSSVTPAGEAAGSGSASGIIGEQLYVWFFDALSAPVTVNLQDYGLFTGSDAEWTAEGDNFITDFNTLDINIIDNAVFGSVNPGTSVTLAAVPEPSAFALLAGAFGIAAVMIRRRR